MTLNLTHVPLRVSAEWQPKIVTTDPPWYTPHTEWSIALTLTSAVPVRVAIFLIHGPDTQWGLEPDPPSQEVDLRVSFFPRDWAKSDDVQVNFGGLRWAVTDGALKNDPGEVVKVTAPAATETGNVFEVADLATHGISLAALAVVNEDTERRRHERWRIKPHFAASLSQRLLPLTSGLKTGVIRGLGDAD